MVVALCNGAHVLAQRGPGGVSTETPAFPLAPTQSTCRLWLDASSLTSLADGDDLTSWTDMSASALTENAFPGALAPFFRDDPAFSINGYPVVTFEDGRFLQLATSTDLNIGGIASTKTVIFAFRTSDDVTTKQIIYEEGGTVRGYNISIHNGNIYLGAYDFDHNDNDGSPPSTNDTPAWGYSYVFEPIAANTTYILSTQFFAQSWGPPQNNSNYFLRGTLNGSIFDILTLGSTFNAYTSTTPDVNLGIGTLAPHPDPIGIGAINNGIVDKDAISTGSGNFPFKGRLAEICYWNDFLTETERIIVENYLGAKYFANFTVNDKYQHEVNYGSDVIGIGQETNDPLNRHNLSKGRNPFAIELANVNLFTANDQYFLTGHNGGNLTYSDASVPFGSPNIQRLERIWRVDRRNLNTPAANIPIVKFRVNTADLPPAPAGFSKLVLLVDITNPNFPNFSLANTEVRELQNIGGGFYEISNYGIADNRFYTFGWARPEVNFVRFNSTTIENNSAIPTNLSGPNTAVRLNYRPHPTSPITKVDYSFQPATALRYDDFNYTDATQASGLTFPAASQFANIPCTRINDTLEEIPAVEFFQIVLLSGLNTTTNLIIGERDTLNFFIFDNDASPQVSFDQFESVVNEPAVGFVNFPVAVRKFGPDSVVSMQISLELVGTTAVDIAVLPNEVDYSFIGPITINFGATESFKTFPIQIRSDLIDEDDEFIVLKITNAVGASFDNSILEHKITITDEDPEPVASFFLANQDGLETQGSPLVVLTLDRYSSKDVEVTFDINVGNGTPPATLGADYDGATSGVVQFQPFDVEGFLGPFTVYSDGNAEANEQIEFQLTGATNATIGSAPIPITTYTIVDYSPFENRGAAGVGKNVDNIVWIDPNRMTGLGVKTSLTNFSPQPISINRYTADANRASLVSSTQLNSKQSIDFNGSSTVGSAHCYQIANSSRINAAGFTDTLAYFFVFRPDVVPTALATNTQSPTTAFTRLIYEQGGTTRGTSVYLYNGFLYFHAWNDNADGAESPWGYDQGLANNADRVASSTWARSAQAIVANGEYVVSCHYANGSNEPLMVYVNGRKGIMSSNITGPNSVGRLYGHTGNIGLGAVADNTRFHFTTNGGSTRIAAFDGKLGDFIIFHEHELNESRRVIVENYLSAKYNIPLDNADTPQVFDLAFADNNTTLNPDFNIEVAGLGRLSPADAHGDAQGPTSILRVKNLIATAPEAYMVWGTDGRALTNTYPWSYHNGQLPPGIEERSGQLWKVFESPINGVTSADFYIRFNTSANASNIDNNTNLLKLLTHTNTDPDNFSNATVYNLSAYGSGAVAQFNNIPVTNGMYVALGNTNPITNQNTVLPIELLFFRAQLADASVQLNWATSTEINNERFIVERAGGDLLWKPILEQAGAGHSTTRLDYNDADRQPLTGISYYRLKQIDYDGAFAYSDVVSIINQNGNKDESFLYPNPTNIGKVFVHVSKALAETDVILEVYDLAGKLLNQEYFAECPSVIEASLEGLGLGVYIIRLRSVKGTESLKIVVQ